MAILAKSNQIFGGIVPLIGGQSFSVSIDMMDVEPMVASTELTGEIIALQNLWESTVTIFRGLLASLVSTIIARGSSFSIIGVGRVNGLSTMNAQIVRPAFVDNMSSLSFLYQIISMLLFIAPLAICSGLSLGINTTTRTEIIVYSCLAVFLDLIQTLTAVNATRICRLATSNTESFGNFNPSSLLHSVKAYTTINQSWLWTASTFRTFARCFSGGSHFMVSFPAVHFSPPGHIIHRKGWFVK